MMSTETVNQLVDRLAQAAPLSAERFQALLGVPLKPAEVNRIKVDTATTAAANVKLEVGQLTDEVSVTATRPLVNTSSGTPGQTITERQIVEMPLNNRSVLDLALTVGNVTGAAGTEDPDLGSEIPTPGFNRLTAISPTTSAIVVMISK